MLSLRSIIAHIMKLDGINVIFVIVDSIVSLQQRSIGVPNK
jgi:hypothetical protein